MVHPETALQVTGEALIRGCVTVRGFHNYAPRHLSAAVDFLAENVERLPWEKVVSPAFPLDRLHDALAAAFSRQWHRVAVEP